MYIFHLQPLGLAAAPSSRPARVAEALASDPDEAADHHQHSVNHAQSSVKSVYLCTQVGACSIPLALASMPALVISGVVGRVLSHRLQALWVEVAEVVIPSLFLTC